MEIKYHENLTKKCLQVSVIIMAFYCETYYYMYYEVFDVIVAFVLHLNNNIISITAGEVVLRNF